MWWQCVWKSFLFVYYSGQFAVVRKIVEKETGDEFAAKYVRKKRTKASRNGMSREDIKREIEILRMVDNEKIIKVHDVYETDKEMILVMELWVEDGACFKKSLFSVSHMRVWQYICNSTPWLVANRIKNVAIKLHFLPMKISAKTVAMCLISIAFYAIGFGEESCLIIFQKKTI